jgi:septum site-determining protein MinD
MGDGLMGERILITSGKGGAGKSTLAVNCGAALAAMGKKVLLIDADAGMRALDLMLSVSDQVVFDLSDVLAGRCEPVKAILGCAQTGLSLMPAPQTVSGELYEPDAMHRLCKGLSRYYDYVLIDSPAGIGPGAMTAAAGAETALVVSTADPVSVRDAERMASILIDKGMDGLRLVINRILPRLIRRRLMLDLDAVIDGVALRLLGVVPEDERVAAACFAGRPVVRGDGREPPRSAAAAYWNIARRLQGAEVPLLKL